MICRIRIKKQNAKGTQEKSAASKSGSEAKAGKKDPLDHDQ